MRLPSLILLAPLLFVGCAKAHHEISTGNPPEFEIRAIHCNETSSETGWRYSCEGTLLVRDPAFQNVNLMVWYRDISKREGDKDDVNERWLYNVLLSHGVATLTAGAFYTKKTNYGGGLVTGEWDKDPGAPTPEWQIIGYTKLEPMKAPSDGTNQTKQ